MYQSHLYNITPNLVEPISSSQSLPLFAVNEYSLREWLECLFTGRARRFAEHKLGLQTPLERNIPCLGDSCVNHWVVMLQVAPQTLGF